MMTDCFTQAEVEEASSERTESVPVTLANIEDSLHQTRSKVANLATEFAIFKREFEHERLENSKWKSAVEGKLDLILSILKNQNTAPWEESQSLMEDGNTLIEKQKIPAFVTIRFPDGKVEDIVLNEKDARDIMSGTSQREVVRKLLLLCHGNDISLLRRYSLTGKTNPGTSKKRTWMDTEDILRQVDHDSELDPVPEASQVKMALPLRTILIIQESIKKLFPVDQMLFEVSPKLAAKQVEKLEQDVRGYITAVLNYFSCKYDADGKIVISPKAQNPSKKPRRILGNLEQNNERN